MNDHAEAILFLICVAGISAGWSWALFCYFAKPRIIRRAKEALRAEYFEAATEVARKSNREPRVPAIAYGGPLDGHVFEIQPHIVRVVFNDGPAPQHYALTFTGDPRTGRIFTYVQA